MTKPDNHRYLRCNACEGPLIYNEFSDVIEAECPDGCMSPFELPSGAAPLLLDLLSEMLHKTPITCINCDGDGCEWCKPSNFITSMDELTETQRSLFSRETRGLAGWTDKPLQDMQKVYEEMSQRAKEWGKTYTSTTSSIPHIKTTTSDTLTTDTGDFWDALNTTGNSFTTWEWKSTS